MTGLSPTGFERKRLADIKTDLEASLKARFGSINLAADSVFGQFIGAVAKPLADLWEAAEAVYFSEYPATSSGISLDEVASIAGVSRLGATATRIEAVAFGAEDTVVPALSQAAVSGAGIICESLGDTTITKDLVRDAEVGVGIVADSTDYTVTLNGTPFTIDSGIGATATSIIAALVTEIDGGAQPVDATDLGNDTLRLIPDDLRAPFSLSVSANLTLIRVGSPIVFQVTETGAKPVPAATLTQIVTPISGWDAVSNLEAGQTGREQETDTELRLRRRRSVRILGAASLASILARALQEIENVTTMQIFENRSHLVDGEGRPPHSFETVVEGGSDTDVAVKLYELKPAGIETFGNVEVLVQDPQGDLQSVKFSRPTPIWVHLEVDLELYTEETFPGDGLSAVAAAVLAYGESLGVGQDVIGQRFYGPAFTVPGIESVTVRIATSATELGAPGAFAEGVLAIAQSELAKFAAARISVGII